MRIIPPLLDTKLDATCDANLDTKLDTSSTAYSAKSTMSKSAMCLGKKTQRNLMRKGMIWAIAACSMLSFSACQRVEVFHGHRIKPETVRTFTVGQTTKESVLAALGTPTSILPYDGNTLYYLSHIVYNQALAATQPVSSQCYALTFSDSGVLCKIASSAAPYPVTICKEATPLPSQHHEGFFQQVWRHFEKSPPLTTLAPG